MDIRPDERVAVFIDSANLHGTTRALRFDIDFRKLLELLAERGRLVRAYYYTALVETEDHSPVRPLVDWLEYNGYTTVTKPAKEFAEASG